MIYKLTIVELDMNYSDLTGNVNDNKVPLEKNPWKSFYSTAIYKNNWKKLLQRFQFIKFKDGKVFVFCGFTGTYMEYVGYNWGNQQKCGFYTDGIRKF